MQRNLPSPCGPVHFFFKQNKTKILAAAFILNVVVALLDSLIFLFSLGFPPFSFCLSVSFLFEI
jgi:hypothetical protein